MRTMLIGMCLLLNAALAKAQAPMIATDITAEQVQAFLKDIPRDRQNDRPMRVVDTGGDRIGVYGVFRPKNTPLSAESHQTNFTEIYYMLDGAAVLVTGGSLREPVRTRTSTLGDWTDLASQGIEGGVSRRVVKGDIIIVPGGVPHGWASLEGDITYLIIRSDPSKKIPLK